MAFRVTVGIALVGMMLTTAAACGGDDDDVEQRTAPTAPASREPCALEHAHPTETPTTSTFPPLDQRPRRERAEPSQVPGLSPQDEIRSDIQAVESYGALHPDSWAGVAFGGADGTRVVAYFTDEVDRHRTALETQVDHPELLDVLRACYRLAHLQDVHDEISAHMEGGRVRSLAQGFLVVEVDLSSAELDLAEELVERFGDAVRVTVGGRPYPPDDHGDQESLEASLCDQVSESLVEAGTLPSLEMSISLESPSVPSGSTFSGTLELRNGSGETVEMDATGARSAWVVRSGTLEVVGHHDGPMTLQTGPFVSVAPGSSQEVPITGGTTPCDASGGYTLAPGEYEVVALVSTVSPEGSESLLTSQAPIVLTRD